MHSRQHLHHIFSNVVNRAPQRTAIVQGEQSITYGELDEQSDQLALALKKQGVCAGDIIALKMTRSIDLIVATLAVLKAEAVYLPLDDACPVARLKQCLEIAHVRIVIADGDVSALLTNDRVCLSARTRAQCDTPNRLTASELSDDAPAYVMFTSGTTGVPKGVVVPYRAIVRLVIDTNYIEIGAADAILQFSPVSFDASTFEIWGALLNGAKLVLYSGEILDPNTLKSDIKDRGVTIMWLTAALFHIVALNFPEALKPLRVLLAGGDVLHADVVRKVLDEIPGITLINGYGPTENTTFTCCHRMTIDNLPSQVVPIGRAITGTGVFILDEHRQPVKPHEAGELYVSGLGVALGYLHNDDDASAFFTDPHLSDGLIYRTGDQVRHNAAGEIEFLGRHDNQVKIRGFRVSLEEVCANLIQLESVKDAVAFVDKQEGGDQLLVACLKVGPDQLDQHETVREQLAQRVPAYMIPDHIVMDADLPVNKNGKLDRSQIVTTFIRGNGREPHE